MGNGQTDRHTHTQINYCKTDRWLPGTTRKEKVYSDMVLLCRQRTSLKVFNTLTNVMKWILYNNGIKYSLHLLDDSLFLGMPKCGECGYTLQMALNKCTEFGISISVEKSKMPIHRNTFLGITIDSLSIELQIPAQKLSWLNRIVETWAHKKVCSA